MAYDQNKMLSLQDQRIIHGIRSAHMIGFDHNVKRKELKKNILEAQSQLTPAITIEKVTEQKKFSSHSQHHRDNFFEHLPARASPKRTDEDSSEKESKITSGVFNADSGEHRQELQQKSNLAHF